MRGREHLAVIGTLILVLLVNAPPVFATAGDLDWTFGNYGIVTTVLGGGYCVPDAMDAQADGKLVTVGSKKNGFDNYDFVTLRYNPSGALDSSFGSGGMVQTAVGPLDDHVSDVVIQDDGKIVVVGVASTGSANACAVVRYNPDGSLDPSYGRQGRFVASLGVPTACSAGVLLPSGTLVVAGNAGTKDNWDFVLLRLEINGALDTSFGSGGVVIVDAASESDSLSGLAANNEGALFVAGSAQPPGGGRSSSFVMKFLPNGARDSSFGSGGRSDLVADSVASDVRLAIDGKALLGGYSTAAGGYGFTLSRFGTDGRLDANFADGGISRELIGPGPNAIIRRLAIQPDDKVLAVGDANNGANDDFALARYLPNGELDPTFGYEGEVTTFIGPLTDRTTDLVLEPAGKVTVSGWYYDGTTFTCVLARYELGELTICGNGDVEPPEQCDDGDDIYTPGDYCSDSCTRTPCGTPTNPSAQLPTASDALFVLQAAVSQVRCDLRVCDVDANASISATDALLILKKAVGEFVPLDCPE